MNFSLIEVFHKGGPIMWPLLVTAIVALTVVLERVYFLFREPFRQNPQLVDRVVTLVDEGNIADALEAGSESRDCAVRTVHAALKHREHSLSSAVMHAAGRELEPYSRGLSVLDTAITLSPLLGLLGTVTGMIRSFNLVGGAELGTPTAITGGIAEALIATAFGLGIAILCLIPFNILNSKLEKARRRIEDAATQVEISLQRSVS